MSNLLISVQYWEMNNECEELFLNLSRAQLQLIILHFKNLLVFTTLVYGWEIAILLSLLHNCSASC